MRERVVAATLKSRVLERVRTVSLARSRSVKLLRYVRLFDNYDMMKEAGMYFFS